jgi:ribosome-interacting GTPase 1
MMCWEIFIDMKLINTISNVVTEAKEAYELACDKGVPEKELDRLEKNYYESLKLLRIYENLGKKPKHNLLDYI